MAKPLWLPSFFASGMILQQQVPCLLRGRSSPSAEISLKLERAPSAGRSVSPLDSNYGLQSSQQATCDSEGKFAFRLPAFDASFDPFTLTVSDNLTTIVLRDILFGEVWICAGGANMQMPLGAVQNAEQIAASANLNYVRVLLQSATGLEEKNTGYTCQPADNLSEARWVRGDQPEAMAQVSAVGFSFAREVHLDLKIPVALLETALANTRIHAWLRRETIEQQPELKKHIQESGLYRDENDWNSLVGKDMACHQPGALFNSKIAPLQGIGARGILWYHGESDYQYPAYYQKALHALLKDWQQIFSPADKRGLGFLYVQLTPHYYGHPRFYQLAEFNEMLSAVRRNLSCPAALVTNYDLPLEFNRAPEKWRHPSCPTSKLPIGVRLKTVAMGLLYQHKAPLSAPECTDIEVVGNKMMLSFSNFGEGLRLTSGDASRLRGFTICGSDRIFIEAQCRILYGLKVLVWHDQIEDPQAVAYAYADFNQEANLISKDHLPVVPFRSDRLPSSFCPPMEWTHCDDLRIWCCPKYSQIETAGWHPAWQIERGQGDLKIEKANKNEGDGSLFLRYQTNDGSEFGVEPILHYDSQFPPLDLSAYSLLSIDVFNTDQQIKYLRLGLACGSPGAPLQILPTRVTILPALRWQRLQFDLRALDQETRALTSRIVFIIDDRKGKGVLFLDQIRLIHP